MVEMRWVVREHDEGFERMPGITDDVGTNRILQYRVFRLYRIEGNRATPVADWSDHHGWTEWMDVPLVTAV